MNKFPQPELFLHRPTCQIFQDSPINCDLEFCVPPYQTDHIFVPTFTASVRLGA